MGVVIKVQNGPFVALHHSTPNHAIGPKTKDRDDNDLGDQLQVHGLYVMFVHRSPSSFACVHSCHITFKLLLWRLFYNFIDVCILHYYYR